jgi:hypothetical protein
VGAPDGRHLRGGGDHDLVHGDSTFPQDQTLVRALVFTDVVPRYEGAFVWYKQVLKQLN